MGDKNSFFTIWLCFVVVNFKNRKRLESALFIIYYVVFQERALRSLIVFLIFTGRPVEGGPVASWSDQL